MGLLSVNRFCIFKVQTIREDRQATLTEKLRQNKPLGLLIVNHFRIFKVQTIKQ